MNFHFVPSLVRTRIQAHSQQEVIEMVAETLIHEGYVSQHYPKQVMEREALYPTGLVTKGAVIAIPHSFSEDIKGNHVAIGILKTPVSFKSMEDTEQCIQVQLIFMLAIHSAHEQLEMLQVLMQMFKEEQLLKQLSTMEDRIAICALLNTYIDGL